MSIADAIAKALARRQFQQRWPPSSTEIDQAFASTLAREAREEQTARHLARALKESGCRFVACRPEFEVVQPEPFEGEGCDWSAV